MNRPNNNEINNRDIHRADFVVRRPFVQQTSEQFG